MRPTYLCALATAGLLAVSVPASAEMMKMAAALSGKSEVPANATAGTGRVDVTYDTATKMLSWQGAYTGLTGPATVAHFHGPAEIGANAPVLIPSPAATPITGTATITDAQAAELMAGKLYFNVHTAANPGGEIRGQVIK